MPLFRTSSLPKPQSRSSSVLFSVWKTSSDSMPAPPSERGQAPEVPVVALAAAPAAPAANLHADNPEVSKGSIPDRDKRLVERSQGCISDNDSALGGNNSIDESAGFLGSSIYNFRKENGRTYHSYKDGKWFIPNDEGENDRLDLQHHMYLLSLDGALGLCPLNAKDAKVGRVLDVGTGTGIWAVDYADEHPESTVLGNDLSPPLLTWVPPNLTFEVDDIDEPWSFKFKFEYIHSRMMTGALANFPRFFEQAFASLEPGGWLETQDLSFPSRSDDGTLLPDSALWKWTQFMTEAAGIFGRPLDTPPTYTELMEKAGFINVSAVMIPWPQNGWPKEKKFKELGVWCQENLVHGVEGICMALFTRALGWTKEEVKVFLVDVRKDMKNRRIHAYWPMWVVYGQKPLFDN